NNVPCCIWTRSCWRPNDSLAPIGRRCFNATAISNERGSTLITCTNTKSALTAAQTRHWLDGRVRPPAAELADAGFIACLPDPLIPSAADLLRGTGVRVGAQDCWYDAGDATGETPAGLLREVGCTHVMLGHADRRERGETDELIARKTTAAVAAGLVPLVCLGE